MQDRRTLFAALVADWSRELYRYAYWLCGDAPQAEDLVQETYTRAWRAIGQLRDTSAARSWLYTTLRHEHARLFQRRPLPRADADPDTLADRHRDFDDSTEAQVLRSCLRKLPEDYREPLVLQVIGGYSCEEIGRMLGISEGAVMTRLCRARQRLRLALEGQAGPDTGARVNELP